MRLRPLALALVLCVAAGCHDGVTGPLSGLPTTLSFGAASPGEIVPSVVGAGDSVVATVILGASACDDYKADAGLARGTLVITLSMTETNRFCPDYLVAGVARVTVHGLRAGEYRTVVNLRIIPISASAQTKTVLQSDVSLP